MSDNPVGHSVILFYKYVEVADLKSLEIEQEKICQSLNLLGRILISQEGINGTLSSCEPQNLEDYICFLCTHPVFQMKKEDFKHSFHPISPFYQLVIKSVKEIVSTGGLVERPNMNVTDQERGYLTPQEFHKAMEQAIEKKEDTIILDVRGHKEYLVGHFESAVDPQVKNFSEYYTFLQQQMETMRNKKVLMYCTGGIRCEKASNYLRHQGLSQVYHLKGGIHKYLETYSKDGGYFKGKNFVFDKRYVQ